VSPLIRRVVAHNPSKFTYLGTGTYIVGRGEVAVVDPGPDMSEHVDAIVDALEPGERVSKIVITHTHSDHSPATPALAERTDAPAWGFGPHGEVPDDDPADRIVFGDEEADRSDAPKDGDILREAADTSFDPDTRIGHGDVIAGKGWTLEAIHTPGHTSNHLCYALREENAVFTGDHVMGWSTSVIGPPDGQLGAYLDSLRLLLDRDDSVYWPTHGPPVTEPHSLVRAFLAHRGERTEQVLRRLRRGPTTIAELVPEMYPDVSKGLWRPAAASTYAHLLMLMDEGRVTSDGPAKRTSVYRLVA
jgi:glyoxylase-like metal-dependent hydrolase (beta-lactamase superfamily II)